MPDIQSLPSVPESHAALLGAPHFAHVCTINTDGSPQSSPVWLNREGAVICLNSAEGRRKIANMRRDPRVAISIIDAANPYRYVELRGRVIEMTHEGADAHIDQLAKDYLDVDAYPYRSPGEQRVLIRIAVEHVVALN